MNILSAMNKMTHMKFGLSYQFNTPSQLGRTSSIICLSVATIHPSNALPCTAWPLPCSALFYLFCIFLFCPVLIYTALLCCVLFCSAFVLFCSAFVRIMKKKKWSRMYHTDSKLVSEYVPLVPDQSQPTRSQRHSEYNSYHWSQTSNILHWLKVKLVADQ